MTREEAIKIVKSATVYTPEEIEALETLIPELAESEDERIRKALCDIVRDMPYMETELRAHGLTVEKTLAYLEKQKEQKSTPDWMPKFLDELRSKKNYFDWDEHREIEGHILAIINWIAPDYFDRKEKEQDKCPEYCVRSHCIGCSIYEKQKEQKDYRKLYEDIAKSEWFKKAYEGKSLGCDDEQNEKKPILEVFGFKVGDAVRLKDGDGRKHIIKSFEEVEGVHGPNFYHVEFEDNSARDGIYPGEEYPNGYYTQMEKFEEEQKSAEWDEFQPNFEAFKAGKKEVIDNPERYGLCRPAEWSEEDEKMLQDVSESLCSYQCHLNGWREPDIDLVKQVEKEKSWLKSLPERFNLQPKQEWSEWEMKVLNSIIDDYEKASKSFCGYDGKIGLLKAIRGGEYNLPNPVEWSEEDEKTFWGLTAYIPDEELERLGITRLDILKKFKSLRPQAKEQVLPSLSEKEIVCLKRTLDYLREEHCRYGGRDFTNEIAVLEYLITHPTLVHSSQPHWKPSEEQMNALEECGECKRCIKELREQLKKS